MSYILDKGKNNSLESSDSMVLIRKNGFMYIAQNIACNRQAFIGKFVAEMV